VALAPIVILTVAERIAASATRPRRPVVSRQCGGSSRASTDQVISLFKDDSLGSGAQAAPTNEVDIQTPTAMELNVGLHDLLAAVPVQDLSYREARDMIRVLRDWIVFFEKQADAAVEKRHFD
jgi:hypothetical protein